MDPDVGRLLAGRTALESMPANERRRPAAVGRSIPIAGSPLDGGHQDGLRTRSRATGPKAMETATSPERHLSFETEGDRR